MGMGIIFPLGCLIGFALSSVDPVWPVFVVLALLIMTTFIAERMSK